MTVPSESPRVSIIMPAYNAAPYIAAALTSALAQTLDDIEILVCDDASTDATAEIVARFVAADARVRYFRLPINGGPSAARNLGIDESRGRWLALLDADDALLPDRLANMVGLAEAHDAILCSDNLMLEPEGTPGDVRPMIPDALLKAPRVLELPEFIFRNVADPAYPGVNYGFLKPIMRRDFIVANGLRYDEKVRFAEDFAFYLECFRLGASWWMMPEAGYRYRVRGDSLTQVQTVHDLDVLRKRLATLLAESIAAADPALPPLIRRHKRVVDRCYHYRAFTDAVKARKIGAAAGELLGSPRSALLIAEELLNQVPTIAAKLLKGGYFHTPVRPAVVRGPT